MKKLLLLITFPCLAMDIPQDKLLALRVKEPVAVMFNNGFFVNNKEVQRADLDDTLRKIDSEETLNALLTCSYIKANMLSDGSFKMTSEARAEGGTKLLAGIAWLGLKVCAVLPAVVAHKVAKNKDEREGGHEHRDKHPSVVHRSHRAADNLESVSQGMHVLHGHGADVAIEAGTSFIVDSQSVQHIIDPNGTGDHTYMATIMAMGPQSMQQAQGYFDRAADSAYNALKDLPPFLGV